MKFTIAVIAAIAGAAALVGWASTPLVGCIALAIGIPAYYTVRMLFGIGHYGEVLDTVSSLAREADGVPYFRSAVAALMRNAPGRRKWAAYAALTIVGALLACAPIAGAATTHITTQIAQDEASKIQRFSFLDGVLEDSIRDKRALTENDGVLQQVYVSDIAGAPTVEVEGEYEIIDRAAALPGSMGWVFGMSWFAAAILLKVALMLAVWVRKGFDIWDAEVKAWTKEWKGADPAAALAALEEINRAHEGESKQGVRPLRYWVAPATALALAISAPLVPQLIIPSGELAAARDQVWVDLSDAEVLAPGTSLAGRVGLGFLFNACTISSALVCDQVEVATRDGDVIKVQVVVRGGETLLVRDIPPTVERTVQLAG